MKDGKASMNRRTESILSAAAVAVMSIKAPVFSVILRDGLTAAYMTPCVPTPFGHDPLLNREVLKV